MGFGLAIAFIGLQKLVAVITYSPVTIHNLYNSVWLALSLLNALCLHYLLLGN
jgi:hypothetical protein